MPPPPIDRADEERLTRLFNRMLDERLKPVESRVVKHSGQIGAVREEVSPAVARKIAESEHHTEDRNEGFERIVMKRMDALAEAVARVEAGQQPRATVKFDDGCGTTSIQPASLVAAQSSVRTEVTANQTLGRTLALQVGVDSADTNSLSAKKAATTGAISGIVTAVLVGGYTAWQVIHALFP